MYLQITTKCNMACQHCCYSCKPGKGIHMSWDTAIDAINFASGYTSSISIGGGEPTLHPRFFDILERCLDTFDYVWMATNGTQTKTMWRLANIIDGCDYKSFEVEDYCTCETEEEREDCTCEPDGLIYQEEKLGVALSLDWAHNSQKVTPKQSIVDLWERRARAHGYSHFEIRNVFDSRSGAAAQGRAKTTGAGWGEHCVCPGEMIKPDGSLRLCGCDRQKSAGDIWHGYTEKAEKIMNSERYQNTNCIRGKS